MQSKLNLAVIYGSSRADRSYDTVGRRVLDQIRARPGVTDDLVDPAVEAPDPPQRIGRADAFIVATPEYNRSYPAPLKAQLDAGRAPTRPAPAGQAMARLLDRLAWCVWALCNAREASAYGAAA